MSNAILSVRRSNCTRFAVSLIREIGRTLSGYVVGQLQIAGILCVLYAVGFAISGVPLWPVVALLGGIFQFIPVLGPVLTLAAALLFIALGSGELAQYVGALITFAVAQGVEGFYLTPKILGRHTRLSPVLIFFGVLVAGLFFGPLGILLAVPVMAVAAIVWRHSKRQPLAPPP
jgi:predicted PurR-regulated permease PerM